ncbi:hypothetical protein C7974DRAFT_162068 [Boeremia exigua]|uniref:uncharacterized protein n=1 Tax=Boeremia exigua TaxID=749465 RepID=UPI001E8D5C1A|nr:uncharacterized protein C7974DRAFT_162068 [Boeremia exigua]KAH6632905.1 hypothetical protein C7974DRAFT_162068 [Boeremia exigua]
MQVVLDTNVSKPALRAHRKTKTGCRTCRIRRVKCDESRPSCIKCSSTGRKCDGYPQNQRDLQTHASSYGQIKSAWPSKALASLPDFGNDMRHLEFYYHCIGPKLSGRFDTEFWSRSILQIAHVEPGVRNALIALSHLNQSQSGTLQDARRSANRPNNLKRRPFWINYNKAIRHLIDDIAKPSFSAEAGLVICLLFACIEFLQADANMAFTHVRSGLNIVHELRKQKAGRSRFGLAAASQGQMSARLYEIEQIMVPILTQALASALPYGTSIERDFEFLQSCPSYYTGTVFTHIADARASFFDLRNAAILLARDMAIKLYGSIPIAASDYHRQTDLLNQHRVWLQALKSLERTDKWAKDATYSLSALKIGYYSSYTAVSCIMDETQMAFDAHLENFMSLVAHAEYLVGSFNFNNCHAPLSPLDAAANFVFDTALIPALFYVAIRCRCPVTRRKAVDLLALNLPREGLWDSEQHRKVAERVIEIEERKVDPRGWPIAASRLCRSSVGTDVDENNGFQASFLYTKDLAAATERAWNERLTLSESHAK